MHLTFPLVIIIPIIFLSSLGIIQPITCNLVGATVLIKYNSHLYPVRYPFTLLGDKDQLQYIVLQNDTSAMVACRIRTHIVTTQLSGDYTANVTTQLSGDYTAIVTTQLSGDYTANYLQPCRRNSAN